MNLFRYYRNAVIYPSLFLLFFSAIYTILDNYKSEWPTARSAMVISMISSCIYLILMHGFSLTIFLNKIQRLHKNLLWNLWTWFLLPCGYIALVLMYDIQNRITYEFKFGNGFIYLLIMTLPFILGLALTFLKYRQQITTAGIP